MNFEVDMYKVFIGRSILQRQDHEFGVGLDVHDLEIGAFIEGDAYINDSEFNFKKINKC